MQNTLKFETEPFVTRNKNKRKLFIFFYFFSGYVQIALAFITLPLYSFASPIPSGKIANVASDSGRHGES